MKERDLIEQKLIGTINDINERISKLSNGRVEAIKSLQTIFWALNWFCIKQEVDKADEKSIEICDNCWNALKGIGVKALTDKLAEEEENEEKVKMLAALALIDNGKEEKWLKKLEDLKLQNECNEREIKKYRSMLKPFFGDEFWLDQ